MKKRVEEKIIQKFPYRCPYCEQEVSYEEKELKAGENVVECPSCQREYIKVVMDSFDERG
jgi:Zn finger protein HypA/HybF involved in hydrogenase expression